MMEFFNYTYRAIRAVNVKINNKISNFYTYCLIKINKVEIGKGFASSGIPILFIHHTSKIKIGKNFKINNRILSNPIGRNYKCLFAIRENAELIIGDNVGFSGTTIVCGKGVNIGSHVKIGGNVCIYDTDFHSLNPKERANAVKDKKGTSYKEVQIGNHVFIGAHSTILKGVTIGENSIIGACSLVSKSIPANEIWAGNPARFIKKI